VKLVWRVVIALIGYCVAVLAAIFVTISLVALAAAFPDQGRFGSIVHLQRNLGGILVFALLYTSVLALPGWLLAVAVGAKGQQTRPGFYIVAGALNALLAHGLTILPFFFPVWLRVRTH
jgi:hypothetical protein